MSEKNHESEIIKKLTKFLLKDGERKFIKKIKSDDELSLQLLNDYFNTKSEGTDLENFFSNHPDSEKCTYKYNDISLDILKIAIILEQNDVVKYILNNPKLNIYEKKDLDNFIDFFGNQEINDYWFNI